MLNTSDKIKETIMLTLLNVALPSVDVYSDIALVVNFLIGSRKNPYCDELYPEDNYNDLYLWHRDRLNCYYNDSMPTTNVTNTSHYGWAAMMFVPFLFNYLICWYVWAITGFTSSTTLLSNTVTFLFHAKQICPISHQFVQMHTVFKASKQFTNYVSSLNESSICHYTFLL